MNDQDFESGASSNPFNSLYPILIGKDNKKPRRRTPVNVWRKTQRNEIEQKVKAIAAKQNASKDKFAALRDKVAREMFSKLPAEEQEHWKAEADIETNLAMAEWQLEWSETVRGDLPNTPRDYQAAIQGLDRVVKPFLDYICQTTGWKASVIMGGPEPAQGGQLNVVSIHSGRTQDDAQLNWSRALGQEYQPVVENFGDFLKECYTAEECRARALAIGSGYAGLTEDKGDNEDMDIDLIGMPGLGTDGSAPSSRATEISVLRSLSSTTSISHSQTSNAPQTFSAWDSTTRTPVEHLDGPRYSDTEQHQSTPDHHFRIIDTSTRRGNPSADPRAPKVGSSRTSILSGNERLLPAFRRIKPKPMITSNIRPDVGLGPRSGAQVLAASRMPQQAPSTYPNPELTPSSPNEMSNHEPQLASQGTDSHGAKASMASLITEAPLHSGRLNVNSATGSRRRNATEAQNVSLPAPNDDTRGSRKRPRRSSNNTPTERLEAKKHDDPPPANPTTSKITLPADAPRWFEDALSMFQSVELGSTWQTIIRHWADFEIFHRFTGSARIQTSGCPSYITDWVIRSRNITWRPKIDDFAKYELEYMTWWRKLQPAWRLLPNGTINPSIVGGNWVHFQKPGICGIYNVIACLFFWGHALVLKKASLKERRTPMEITLEKARREDEIRWSAALEDFCTVADHLLPSDQE